MNSARSMPKMITHHRRAALRASALVAASLALASCGGRPQGVLTPVTTVAADTTRVDVMVATMRQPLPNKQAEMFSGERSDRMSFADVTVSIPPDAARQVGEVQWPASVPGNPAREFVATRAETIDARTAYQRFNQRVTGVGRRKAIVFVHGYNTRFEDAVFRFAQIMHDSKAPGVPVLFTWPSRGEILGYAYDRESANYSRDALATVLQALARDPNVSEIGVLAHSMGNWVALEALRTISLKTGSLPGKITNVMLAAPDVDVDVFRTQISVLGDRRPTMTLFVSQDDKALGISKRFWGDLPRLGAIDPESEPYKEQLRKERINVVDLTKLQSGDKLAHGKFAQSPDVVRFIGQRLAQGQAINEQRQSLGEQLVQGTADVGSFVGGTAARVITAPISLVDGTYRPRDSNDQADKPREPEKRR